MNCKNLVYLRSFAITLTILLMSDFASAQYKTLAKPIYEPRYTNFTLQYSEPRLQLNLPNLQIHKCKFRVYGGTQVDVLLDVENVGNADANVHDVTANVSLVGMQGQTFQQTLYAGLPRGATERKYMGSITLPDRTRDWDIDVTGIVDPPTQSSSGGDIWESNETDNVKVCRTCRVYGENPDVSVPPCD